MLNVQFKQKKGRPLTILCLGAHSDDIEIGCGGTILRILTEYENVEVVWVVFGSSGQRDREAVASAKVFLEKATKKEIIIKHFKTSFFPYEGERIKKYFEMLKKKVSPDVIFSHYRDDRHQDHRLISDLTWNTFRDHMILEYEIPKYDGDLGCPNFFVLLNEATCKRKIGYLLDHFPTQQVNHWFTGETFEALLRLRGIESNATDGYAEAFYCRKIVF